MTPPPPPSSRVSLFPKNKLVLEPGQMFNVMDDKPTLDFTFEDIVPDNDHDDAFAFLDNHVALDPEISAMLSKAKVSQN